jgi:hypothetical protein
MTASVVTTSSQPTGGAITAKIAEAECSGSLPAAPELPISDFARDLASDLVIYLGHCVNSAARSQAGLEAPLTALGSSPRRTNARR